MRSVDEQLRRRVAAAQANGPCACSMGHGTVGQAGCRVLLSAMLGMLCCSLAAMPVTHQLRAKHSSVRGDVHNTKHTCTASAAVAHCESPHLSR